MKIVIDIPEGTYKAISVGTINQVLTNKVWRAIQNGTPLPKGHGDLKDADAIMSIIKENLQIRPEFVIEHAPTIIEADRSVEE